MMLKNKKMSFISLFIIVFSLITIMSGCSNHDEAKKDNDTVVNNNQIQSTQSIKDDFLKNSYIDKGTIEKNYKTDNKKIELVAQFINNNNHFDNLAVGIKPVRNKKIMKATLSDNKNFYICGISNNVVFCGNKKDGEPIEATMEKMGQKMTLTIYYTNGQSQDITLNQKITKQIEEIKQNLIKLNDKKIKD